MNEDAIAQFCEDNAITFPEPSAKKPKKHSTVVTKTKMINRIMVQRNVLRKQIDPKRRQALLDREKYKLNAAEQEIYDTHTHLEVIRKCKKLDINIKGKTFALKVRALVKKQNQLAGD